MMKLFKVNISILALIVAQSAFSTAYDDDEANFYVEGQSLNEALTSVNQIMCFVANMRSDAFVNAGPYKATIYEEDCTTGADTSGDSSSATATSASSSSTASSTSATTSSSKTATTATLNVTRLSSVSPVKAKTWVSSPAQTSGEFAMKIYVDTKQTGGPSDTSPNGDFTMRFSLHADGSQDVFGTFENSGVRDGQFLGQGYLSASGQTLKFKEYNTMGRENNVAAEFKANGDKTGVYGEFLSLSEPGPDEYYGEASMMDESSQDMDDHGGGGDEGEDINIVAYYQFYMSAADKGYCRRLILADLIGFPSDLAISNALAVNEQVWQKVDDAIDSGALSPEQYSDIEAYAATVDLDGDGVAEYDEDPWTPTETAIFDITTGLNNLSQYSSYDGYADMVVDEECFSTDISKAQRNVHRYGVYNDDGSRLGITAGGFPLIAFVEKTFADGNTGTIPIHAYADYWGVHVDPRGRNLITDTTEFSKESFEADSLSSGQTYNLTPQDLKIEKRTTSYVSLNSIDGLTLAMHVNDYWWLNEYKALFGSGWSDDYDEYEGSFDKDTATFTWTKGISFRQGYNAVDLETPVSFTISDWQTHMIKEWGKSTNETTGAVIYEDWYHKETRNLGTWSHDTRQWYEISNSAMSNPTYTDELVYQTDAGVVADAVSGVTYGGRGAYKAGIRTESSSMVSIADVASDMAAAGADKLYCLRDCLDGALTQQTFTDALDDEYPVGQYLSTPFADIGEYLKEDITYSEVEGSGYRTLEEATADFYSGSLTNTDDNTIALGSDVFAVTDYIDGDPNLQVHSKGYARTYKDMDEDRIDADTIGASADSDGNYYRETLELESWEGFSVTNLNKLLSDSADPGDFGVAPSIHFDLRAIPSAGTSGTMKMVVTLYEGDDDVRDDNEKSLSSEATLNWSSDGSEFTVSIPPTAETTMTLVTSGGQAIVGTYGNSNQDSYDYGGGVISTGTADDGEGITWKVFRIFGGHHGHHKLDNLYQLGNLDSFFSAGRYTATIQITETDLAITKVNEADDGTETESDPFKYAILNFEAKDDSGRLRQENRMAGEWAEGLELADTWYYTLSGTSILDQNGVALSKGSANAAELSAMENPEQALQGKMYQTREGWGQEIAWGIRTGELILDTDLSKIECRKNGLEGSESYEFHPVYGTSTTNTRYCGNRLWEGAVDTKYNIALETRPSYEVVYANVVDTDAVAGAVVEISEPKVMYYDVPETLDANGVAIFGKDAGKRIRLEYGGFGDLMGIPGFVFDTATGEDLGQFVNGWSESYRYLNRFNIPDGGILEDATDATKTYKVKALAGEEWLTKADGTVSVDGSLVPDLRGTYTALYEGSKDDLVPDRKLRIVGPEDWDNDGVADNTEEYIGIEPTTAVQTSPSGETIPALIENGKTCVVQGEVLCGANAGT